MIPRTLLFLFVLHWSDVVVHAFLAPLPNEVTRIRRSSTANKELDPEKDLDKILKPNKAANKISINNHDGSENEEEYPDDKMSDLSTTPYLEEHDPEEPGLGDVNIPTTGISVADEMEKASKDRFYTEVVRISGLGKGVKAAQIISSTTGGGIEPVRYFVRLARREEEDADEGDADGETDETSTTPRTSDEVEDYVMVDVPPYSEKLVKGMQKMMGPNGRLSAILVTCRDSIHYDDAPGVFTIRRADLLKWEKAFPKTAIVAYRMDIPRDCRESVTQRLDGYGPWAMQDASAKAAKNETFIETGIPMTYNEWDREIAMDILEGRRAPPSEEEVAELSNNNGNDDDGVIDLNADGKSQAKSLRENEDGKRILAVYTPGRTYGSMSYVFPELGLCASGFSLPLEDAREETWGVSDSAGPALDCRGYVTTSKAGIAKQMESARKLTNNYIDRFRIVLSSRGDPFYLQEEVDERRQTLLEIVDQYEKLGTIYEQLGITGSSDFE